VVGVVIGLVYGWMINPVTYVNTTPDNLRSDYKADYVLMVAEIFQAEQNLPMAERRLELLGDDAALRQVQRAIVTAQELGYNSRDLETLGRFSTALQSAAGTVGQPAEPAATAAGEALSQPQPGVGTTTPGADGGVAPVGGQP
jgi:hypothetical protein